MLFIFINVSITTDNFFYRWFIIRRNDHLSSTIYIQSCPGSYSLINCSYKILCHDTQNFFLSMCGLYINTYICIYSKIYPIIAFDQAINFTLQQIIIIMIDNIIIMIRVSLTIHEFMSGRSFMSACMRPQRHVFLQLKDHLNLFL